MTLSTTANRKEYAGDGVTTAFAFPYYFLANADIVVEQRVDSTGVSTVKALTTDYTLAGAGLAAGGTVTMLVAPPSGQTLVVYRQPAAIQGADFVTNDISAADSYERAIDLLTMLVQTLQEKLGRALVFPISDPASLSSIIPSSVSRASQVLGFDANGNPAIVSSPVVDTSTLLVVASSAPPHVNGRIWVDTSTPSHLIAKQSDGTDWIQLWDVNTSTNVVTIGITDGTITNAKLADMATQTFKGRTTAGTGDPEDLTVGQATAMLNVAVASGASHAKGLVPDPGATPGTTKFLREDMTWNVPAGSTPTGAIMLFGAAAAPAGWLLCNGAAVNRTTYSDLFAAVGTTWGVGDGSTTFNVPDLRGRVPVGAGTGAGLTARTLAATGGEEGTVLVANNLPAHTHDITTPTGSTGSNTGFMADRTGGSKTVTSANNSTTNTAHNTMQPFVVTNYIIKT